MAGYVLSGPRETVLTTITQKLHGRSIGTTDFKRAAIQTQNRQIIKPLTSIGRVKCLRTFEYISKNVLNFSSCQIILLYDSALCTNTSCFIKTSMPGETPSAIYGKMESQNFYKTEVNHVTWLNKSPLLHQMSSRSCLSGAGARTTITILLESIVLSKKIISVATKNSKIQFLFADYGKLGKIKSRRT